MSGRYDQRREYARGTMDATDLGDDPIAALRRWIDEAIATGAPEPHAMTLATVDPDGAPSARVVLCRAVDEEGLSFYTNYESRKGRALAREPRACACFFWPALERQVRVEGTVRRTSRADSAAYFHGRPRGSQLAAVASRQSAVIPDRAVLEAEVARLDTAFPGEVPLPDGWGGFVLRPAAIEFWQGRPSRLHDRIVFSRGEGGWRTARLAP